VSDLDTFLWLIPFLLVSLVLHELAHALVATRLGDPTPREHGG
jgi:Zn-dependent protease